MTDYKKVCLVALLLGLVPLALAGLSLWLGEALVFIRHLHVDITREEYPFWFWFFIVLYVVVGILFIYGGLDGLIQGSG